MFLMCWPYPILYTFSGVHYMEPFVSSLCYYLGFVPRLPSSSLRLLKVGCLSNPLAGFFQSNSHTKPVK